jgi:hypothetical protein
MLELVIAFFAMFVLVRVIGVVFRSSGALQKRLGAGQLAFAVAASLGAVVTICIGIAIINSPKTELELDFAGILFCLGQVAGVLCGCFAFRLFYGWHASFEARFGIALLALFGALATAFAALLLAFSHGPFLVH